MGSVSKAFSSRQTGPQDGLLGVPNSDSSTRPSNNRSQSALLPLQHVSSDMADEPGPPASSVQAPSPPAGEAAKSRTRAHTVAVALASGRKDSQTNVTRRRRRSSVSNNARSMEEGRASQASDRAGSGVNFELGNSDRDLDDETVGVLDCIDPEVSTSKLLFDVSFYST